MKIYSSKYSDESLYDFIGEDVWVRVQGEEWSEDLYARIVGKIPGAYQCNLVPSDDVDLSSHAFTQDSLSTVFTIPDSEMWLSLPLDYVSTEEVYESAGRE